MGKIPRYAFYVTDLNYGGIPQRAVVVWSEEVKKWSVVDPAIKAKSSPQAEVNGFAVYRSDFVKDLRENGPLPNASTLTFFFNPVKQYQILKPEIVTVDMTPIWSGYSQRPLIPTSFDLLIEPDYFPVQATVFCEDGVFTRLTGERHLGLD